MSERVVDNPANHGWVDAGGGKWTWAGTGTDGGPAVWDEIIDKPDEFPPSEHNHDADYAAIDHDHEGVYQPVGNYIEGDAPSDGELYVRKDGGWELYTPSSGGGANMIEPTIQPTTFGPFTAGNFAAVYEGQSIPTGEVICQVPAGFSLLIVDFTAGTGVIPTGGIYFDGVPVFQNFPAELKQDRLLFGDQPGKPLYVVKNELKFTVTATGFAKLTCYFVPADGTRESADLRDAYLIEEAERIAAMPQPEPEEVGTQEIPE